MLFNNYFINYKIIVLQGLIRGPCYRYVEKMGREKVREGWGERKRGIEGGEAKRGKGREKEKGREGSSGIMGILAHFQKDPPRSQNSP